MEGSSLVSRGSGSGMQRREGRNNDHRVFINGRPNVDGRGLKTRWMLKK